MAGDVLIFPSLFKADKALWAGAWVFHAALATILFRHLRYFTYPVPGWSLAYWSRSRCIRLPVRLAVLFLFWRRLALPRRCISPACRIISRWSLLGLIAGTGILVSYWLHVYLVDVKAYPGAADPAAGRAAAAPAVPGAFLLVWLLMIYFPFSKLLHAGGVFFSPTRNQPYVRPCSANERGTDALIEYPLAPLIKGTRAWQIR